MRSIETLVLERQAKPARARRSCRVFDEHGVEVFITKLCPKCRKVKPLARFGLRRMDDGRLRDCPWCSACRSASSAANPKRRKPALGDAS